MDLEEEESLFADLRPQSASFPYQKATFVIIAATWLVLLYLIWSHYSWRKISISKVKN